MTSLKSLMAKGSMQMLDTRAMKNLKGGKISVTVEVGTGADVNVGVNDKGSGGSGNGGNGGWGPED